MSVKDNRHKFYEQSTSAYSSESGSRDEMGENVFTKFLVYTLKSPAESRSEVSYVILFLCIEQNMNSLQVSYFAILNYFLSLALEGWFY